MDFSKKVKDAAQSERVDFGGSDSRLGRIPRKRLHLRILTLETLWLILGALLITLAVNLFIAPHNIAPGGATGLGVILTSLTGFPLGMTMLAINIPTYLLGYRFLGGGSFLIRSAIATLIYNVAVDLSAPLFPAGGLTEDMILNALFGGVIAGIGAGFVYRAGGVSGAGGISNRLLHNWFGLPYKMTGLVTNSLVIGLAGLVFGWDAILYAIITFYATGTLADFVLEGPDMIRTALIITDKPEQVAEVLISTLGRGVTRWTVYGMYANKEHTALYCTVTRPEISALKNVVADSDPGAFVIIGRGHEALGSGFRQLKSHPPVVEDIDQDAEDKQESAHSQ
jgi:uncharacterized membrane-anchored protein YitT (DUF2179 family)